jgi:uracil-DNA glycosylase family 4
VTDAERRAALEAIADEVRTCTRCRLHEQRTQAVPGEGHASTEVMFVGEGPGRDEDAQGRPFVGESGKLLTRLIGSLGWRRDDVYITNVVKCRPPGNRDPASDEIAACAPVLRRQLAVLDPAIVVTLGRFSLATFRPGERIGQAHGTGRDASPASGAEGAQAFAMYHPAYAVRDPRNETTLFDDIGRLPAALVEARKRREGEIAPHPEPAMSDPAFPAAVPAGAAAAERTVDTSTRSGEARPEPPLGAPLEAPHGAQSAMETDPADSLQIPLF